MRKLTQVSVALVLGLLVSLSMFGAGAFAKSAHQALASCGNSSSCNSHTECVTQMQSFKQFKEVREVLLERVAVVHREVKTVRVARFVRRLVTIHSGSHFVHVWRSVKVWQYKHVVRLVHTFQIHQVVHFVKKAVSTQHAVRVCHQVF